MVRTQEPSDQDKLDRIIQEVTGRHGLKTVVTGWSRKTYDVFREEPRSRLTTHLIRVESFATTSGEVVILHEDGQACAREIAEALEQQFDIEDAIIIDRS